MHLIQVIVIYFIASIDSMLLLMRKGATCKKLSFSKRILYPLVCCLISLAAITLGYGISRLFNYPVINRFSIFITANIVLGIGIWFIWKGRREKVFEERLDESFTLRHYFNLALLTNVDTLFIGLCFGLVSFDFFLSLLVGTLINFCSALIGFEVGYQKGYYGKWASIIGGFLMIGFGIYFGFKFVL